MRPRKAKDPKDEEDDEPIYVDEESNEVISKEEYKALVKGDGPEDDPVDKDASTADDQDKLKPQSGTATSKQSNLTEIGGQKKRKQVKVVGEDSKPESEETQPKEAQPKTAATRKPKKAKKIKLSFDEE